MKPLLTKFLRFQETIRKLSEIDKYIIRHISNIVASHRINTLY